MSPDSKIILIIDVYIVVFWFGYSNVYLHNGGYFLRRSSGIINLVKSHSKMVLVSFPSIIRDLLPCIRCLGDLFALEMQGCELQLKLLLE
jgi:hypothetical protein